ncbi:MAG: glycosyltransferase [Verrucomicrobiaceae bacterium]|nr:MAG: glycosyltransferase [Verrucomicrobiaceae bacterium]
MNPISFTAIVAAYDRPQATCATIRALQACVPPPAEILVHLDNNADFELPDGVRILKSNTNIGPGGGRNRMIRESRNEWIASFDDDSFPVLPDYFSRLAEAVQRHPEAGVIAAIVRHRDPRHDAPSSGVDREVASFIGCGCTYRKSAYLQTSGYVPLPVAYGMEEIDLALQLHQQAIPIFECADLDVFHDTDLDHHHSSRITSGSIMNQALLAWLRYPVSSLPYGVLQWLNKGLDNLRRRRYAGTFRGLFATPFHLWKYRKLRKPVSHAVLRSFRDLVRFNGRPLPRREAGSTPILSPTARP